MLKTDIKLLVEDIQLYEDKQGGVRALLQHC